MITVQHKALISVEGNEWKHNIFCAPTQSTLRTDRHSGWNSRGDNQLALLKEVISQSTNYDGHH